MASGSETLTADTPPAAPPAQGSETPPAAPPAQQPPAQQPSAPAQQTGQWYGDIADPEMKGWLDNKGYKTLQDALTGHRNLEKLVGAEKLPMPKDDNDAEGWDRVYKAIGRPDKPDDYQLPVPEGQSDELAKTFSAKFHELGLNTKQARGIAEAWNKMVEETQGKTEAERNANFEKAESELKTEWAGNYDTNIHLGQRAVKFLEFSQDELTEIENTLGTAKLYRMFHKIGKSLSEDTIPNGGGNEFGLTKEGAAAQIQQLYSDPDFTKKYYAGDLAAKDKMARLYKIAHPA